VQLFPFPFPFAQSSPSSVAQSSSPSTLKSDGDGAFVLAFGAQVGLGFDGFSISITAPVAGSIFLTGDAAPNEPNFSLSIACSYSTTDCRL
jgi:hypothetical protein